MSIYIIPIGGTGERVMRGVAHLAAAGVYNYASPDARNIKVLGIDPDATGFAKTMLSETLADYRKLQVENVFQTKMFTGKDVMWTPMKSHHTSLNDDVGVDTDEKELFEFLYSEQPDYMGDPIDMANINGFETMICSANGENYLPTSQQIYNYLCEKKGSNHTIAELVYDVLQFMRAMKA